MQRISDIPALGTCVTDSEPPMASYVEDQIADRRRQLADIDRRRMVLEAELRTLEDVLRHHLAEQAAGRDTSNGNGADHGLNEPIVRVEVERAGFRQVARYDFTKADGQDYFLIFEKR